MPSQKALRKISKRNKEGTMGTVGGAPGGRNDPDYAKLNASAKNAYESIVGKPSNVAGNSLRNLIKRAVEFLNAYLKDGYQPPSNANYNDQIDVCLGRIVSSYEQLVSKHFPSQADATALGGMANQNHVDCLNYLDQLLQLACADLKGRYTTPHYIPGMVDGDYFKEYLDAMASL